MVSFVVYDLIFLAIFTLATVFFLYKRRENLKRQGLLYLYRTNIGLKIMDWTAKKFNRILKPMQYVIIASGYLLMIGAIWVVIRIVSLYTKPEIIRAIKIPPVLPLFPYATDLFKIDFLPPFYFTYWIIIIAVIAISHEFAHGIFARLNKIRVHSTGFGFLGPFLAAFVEPDEKQMNKSKKFPQLSILAAGTFANVVMTVLFALILWLFFASAFTPAGINFNAYPNAIIDTNSIRSVNGVLIENIEDASELASEGDKLTEISIGENKFLLPGDNLRKAIDRKIERIIVFEDAPAVRADFKGPILEINGKKILNREILQEEILKYKPGEEIEIETIIDEERKTVSLELSEREEKAFLGIGFAEPERGRITSLIFSITKIVKEPFIYYEPIWNSNFAWFVYNLLWWLVLINFSVALINMLPVGIFDGGRFFYLTIWGITKSEKIGRKAFTLATWAIVAIIIWLTFQWIRAVF